jgi:hypothetical protein
MNIKNTLRKLVGINPPGDTRPWVKCVRCSEYVMWGNICGKCGMQN